MSAPAEADRVARAALTWVAEPGDPTMGALLRFCSPAEIVAALTEGRMPLPAATVSGGSGMLWEDSAGPGGTGAKTGRSRTWPAGTGMPGLGQVGIGSAGTRPAGTRPVGTGPSGTRPAVVPSLERALPRWAARLGEVPPEPELAACWRDGIRLVIPGDAEWPSQLDVLGQARPWGLWVRGQADLRYACLRSVSVVGTRAATGYGTYVCGEMAVALADAGWTIVSGGAFGIDGCAHRSAIAVAGVTVAVLPCGVDLAYPLAHEGLFRSIREQGVLVSEWPPGRMPTRHGFLVRNRVIAALSRGTVVVEAALRSGALNTARHARDQGRPLMAVPGPVTSPQSAGCHEAIREWGAVCVTGARDVMGLLEFSGEEEPPGQRRGPVLARDLLSQEDTRVLEAVPARTGRGPARIAIAAGVDFDTVMRCLGGLAAAGFVERCERGWRLRRPQPGSHVGPKA
ncbi:MAG TPA: DNA-processing protein DprA [Streptosporangiaceae bacterium]|nr:DNA-processing protein DprA [Streptosporangiaceae bacterium]